MKKQFPARAAGFIAAEAASILVWAFLLSSSGFYLRSAMLAGNISQTISSALRPEFILFLVIFPLTFALIAIQARSAERRQLLINAFAGVLAGGIISALAFPALRQYWLAGMFYLIAVYVCIETASLNFLELKKFVLPRSMMNSMEKAVMAMGIGVFFTVLLASYTSQGALLQDFEREIAAQAGATPESLADASAGLLVQANTQILGQLSSSPQYSALKAKASDREAQDFVAFVQEWQLQASSSEYRDQLKQQILQSGQANVFELVKQRIPFYETLTQWYWLLVTISLTSVFFFIASVLFRPLCALYGTIIGLFAREDKE